MHTHTHILISQIQHLWTHSWICWPCRLSLTCPMSYLWLDWLNGRNSSKSKHQVITGLLLVITQRVVEISCRRFGATSRSQLQGSGIQDGTQFVPKRRYGITTTGRLIIRKSAVLIYFATEGWNHAKHMLNAQITWQEFFKQTAIILVQRCLHSAQSC